MSIFNFKRNTRTDTSAVAPSFQARLAELESQANNVQSEEDLAVLQKALVDLAAEAASGQPKDGKRPASAKPTQDDFDALDVENDNDDLDAHTDSQELPADEDETDSEEEDAGSDNGADDADPDDSDADPDADDSDEETFGKGVGYFPDDDAFPETEAGIDATQAVLTMLQGQAEIAQELHRQNGVVSKALSGMPTQSEFDQLNAKVDALSRVVTGLLEQVPGFISKAVGEGLAPYGSILDDVGENLTFIKGLRQRPQGQPVNPNARLGAGGVLEKAIDGSQAVPASAPSENAGIEARYGVTPRELRKGLADARTTEIEKAGLSMEQVYAITDGSLAFENVPRIAFEVAARRLSKALTE